MHGKGLRGLYDVWENQILTIKAAALRDASRMSEWYDSRKLLV